MKPTDTLIVELAESVQYLLDTSAHGGTDKSLMAQRAVRVYNALDAMKQHIAKAEAAPVVEAAKPAAAAPPAAASVASPVSISRPPVK